MQQKNHFLRAEESDLEKISDQKETYNSCHHNIKKGLQLKST